MREPRAGYEGEGDGMKWRVSNGSRVRYGLRVRVRVRIRVRVWLRIWIRVRVKIRVKVRMLGMRIKGEDKDKDV